ncbi:MAG: tRNA dihydrouridine synthase DusB [Butyrivibrio sp.]|nr:tRNA dihydrouridine synthase DusB [Butyrivibrio sp.]
MKIGNLQIDHPVMLAPMAGVTDLSFRLLCKEQGCGYMISEMISAKAVLYNNKNTEVLLAKRDEEGPVALQFFGSDPEIMADMAARLEDRGFAAFDINMGCPVPKIVNNHEGSALMKDPVLAGKIVETMVRRVKCPVTVKFRKGFDDEHVNAVEFAHIMEECGAASVTVHGRTREQFYSGEADWSIIRDVVDRVNIPVWGNGDVFSAEDALRMVKETGCAGVAVARGAKGNPWIFREIKAALNGEPIPPRPSMEEIKATIKRQTELMLEYKPEYIAIREMRKHVSWYTTGLRNCSALRAEVNSTETMEELFELLDKRMIDK